MLKFVKTISLSATIALVLTLVGFPREAPAQQTLITSLEWEAESSRPADYRGRALASAGAWVKVTLLSAPGIEESALKTEWFLDEAPVSTPDPFTIRFVITRNPGAEHKVFVRARNAKIQGAEEATLLIPVAQPEILVYGLRKDGQPQPHALDSRLAVKPGESFDILAKAYFLPGGAPLFRWFKNGELLPGAPKHPEALVLTAPAEAISGSRERIQAMARHRQFSELKAIKEVIVEIQ